MEEKQIPAKKGEYEKMLKRLGQDKSQPLYQIYQSNCDHIARRLISAIDQDMRSYLQHGRRMTPNGNWMAFGKRAEDWGVRELGSQSLRERILMFLMIF